MSLEQMKTYILEKYDYSPKWVEKVDKMSDTQVIAIYYRMLNSKK